MYDNPLTNAAQCGNSAKPQSVREQLLQRKEMLETNLREVGEALDALDENPGVEKVLTLVGRTVRF